MKGTWGRIAGSPGGFRRVNGPASESGIEREWMVTAGKRMADEREWMVRGNGWLENVKWCLLPDFLEL